MIPNNISEHYEKSNTYQFRYDFNKVLDQEENGANSDSESSLATNDAENASKSDAEDELMNVKRNYGSLSIERLSGDDQPLSRKKFEKETKNVDHSASSNEAFRCVVCNSSFNSQVKKKIFSIFNSKIEIMFLRYLKFKQTNEKLKPMFYIISFQIQFFVHLQTHYSTTGSVDAKGK